jgi:hypothetical protein
MSLLDPESLTFAQWFWICFYHRGGHLFCLPLC